VHVIPKGRKSFVVFVTLFAASSTSWQCTRVTSFLCMGRLSMLWAALLNPTPKIWFQKITWSCPLYWLTIDIKWIFTDFYIWMVVIYV